MSWKPNSIIGFDDLNLLQSSEIESHEDVVKIKNIFQGFRQVNNPTNQVLKEILLFSEISGGIAQEYGNISIQGGEIEQEDNDFFNRKDECNFTNSIINNHSQLLGTQNDYKKTEFMNSIIQEIGITVHMFSKEIILEFDIIMKKYIKYIIQTTIDELRKNPHWPYNEEEFEEELTNMSYYFSEAGRSIDDMILTLNNDKSEEERILGEDNHPILLEMIYQRRQFYCEKRGQIKEYYDMCITQYTIILKLIIISGDGYLPGLYHKLYDLMFIKYALDVIDEYDDSQQE